MDTEKNQIWKERLQQAINSKEFLQLIFKYPEFEKRTFKKGVVIHVYDDGFDFDERFDGNVSYAFDFLVEISGGNK